MVHRCFGVAMHHKEAAIGRFCRDILRVIASQERKDKC